MFRRLTVVLAGLCITACTSTPQVAVIEPSDTLMSCPQIYKQSASLQAVMDEAHHNKGFNLANFFAWPGPIYTHNFIEADNAEEWVQRRRVELTKLYIAKGCAPDMAPAASLAAGHSVTAMRKQAVDNALKSYNE